MSELNYVKSGQTVGAHTINGLIDAVGGPSIPTEDGFVKTSTGSLFTKRFDIGSRSRSFQSEFMDVKLADAPRSLSSSYKMIWIQLGRDLDCVKDRLEARYVYFFDKISDKIEELKDEDFDVNGEDASYDGYVCTGISAIQEFNVKVGESEETVGAGDGYLYGVYIKHEDDASSTKYVITNEPNSSNVAEKTGASSDDIKRVDKIATVTKDRDGFYIVKIPLPAKADVVPGDADVDFTKESLANAVQLSSIHRYDLSGNTWYQLHNFDKTDVSSYAELSSKKPAILVRTSETNDGKEKHILEYVSLSSMLSGSLTDTEYSENRADKQKSIERRTDNDSTFLQLYDFDKDNVVKLDIDENKLKYDGKEVEFLFRHRVEGMNVLKYGTLELSGVSSIVSCIISNDISNFSSVSNFISSVVNNNISNFTNLSTYINNNISNFNSVSSYISNIIENNISNFTNTTTYISTIVSSALSSLSALSGTSCSADSEIDSLRLSSIGIVENDNGKVYELYNFDKMNTDINSRIMTIGGLNADRVGKVGKLIDADGNVLTAVDIVVRDKDTHEIKYMNLSVDETMVDSYIGGAGGTNSIIYTTNWFGFCYLKLYNFENYNANDYLVCNLSSNGKAVFGKDGGQDATYVLCKNYDTNNNRWTLEYKKLQISCNLSGGGEVSSISGDTNVITTRKSIDTKKNGDNAFHQLHNFDNPNPTINTVDMLAKNTAYDTLDSNEYFVIKSGNEVKYKKVQIKDNTPGGGSTSGYSGDVYGDHRLKYNTQGEYQIELWAKKMTYVNGLLTNVGNEELVSTLPTTPLTEEIL